VIEYEEFLTLMTKKLQEDTPIEHIETLGTTDEDEAAVLMHDLREEQIGD
jgi:hypothetical protein